MKHDKTFPDLAALRARAQNANKTRSPVRITKARRPPPDDDRTLAAAHEFVPASPRERRDGWTPEKQVDFIDALGECGCVTEACERVGLSPSTAYRLRRRVDAYSFRAAWDAALDYAIRRLSDAAFSRALHGVARPVWFQGEQVGERLYYDERLTMFLLRYRDPDTYGAWRDRREPRRRPDAQAITLGRWTGHVAEDAHDRDSGTIVDRAREEDGTEWLTDEEAALADAAASAPHYATQEETDARLIAAIAVVRRLRTLGIATGGLTEAEFHRQIGLEEARRAAAGTTLVFDFDDDQKEDDAAEVQEPPKEGA
ncbi:hypothetical protein FHR22_003377 [Sphingopyxis panaciterrae]|uniref:hypothetical protein n=1 Tax=Sphingopyxis panaciterrae TaxID=363841 RepID=UPI001FBBA877|nr:hypothetical protein [Sphingopyxis panaciterrae]NIJ38653.1 hypothetical protein [Sphingopyxis panaciterrae]